MSDEASTSIDLVPLDKLAISPRLRRQLRGLKVKNLKEVFELGDSALAMALDNSTDSEVEGYREAFGTDPEGLRQRLLKDANAKDAGSRGGSTPKATTPSHSSNAHGNDRPKAERNTRYAEYDNTRASTSWKPINQPARPYTQYRMPSLPFSKDLESFETEAKEALADLLESTEAPIIAQSFPLFELKLEDYRESFVAFFRHFADHHAMTRAFLLIEELLPNAYLMFVSDESRRLYFDNTLWEHIYEELHIKENQTAEVNFKSLYMKLLRQAGFQSYVRAEAQLRYKYTALLHAGLSEEAWVSLWENTIVPLVKEGEGNVLDGVDIWRRAVEKDGPYAVKNLGVYRMLTRAPVGVIAPILEAGLKTARQWQRFQNEIHSTVALVSSEGVSREGMRAFSRYIESLQNRGTHSKGGSKHKSERSLFWLNDPTLLIDTMRHENPVCVKIQAQRLSEDFRGRKFEVYANGKLVEEMAVQVDHRGCLMPERNVWVEPAEQFVVEIKIVDDTTGHRREIASHATSFIDDREGVFEFSGRPGDTVLRYQNLHVQRGRAVRRAYVVYPGYEVRALGGASLVPTVQVEGPFSVRVFDMSEGASAAVIAEDETQVSLLQERFATRIHRTWLLGKVGSTDLYGTSHPFTGWGYNDYLPTIEVIAPGIEEARNDFEVTCICDGVACHPCVKQAGMHAVQGQDIDNDGSRLLVELAFSYLPAVIRQGRVRIVHRQTRDTVLEYRFSVAPIRAFTLSLLHWKQGVLLGRYTFECCATSYVSVANEIDELLVPQGKTVTFERPLSDETVRVSFRSPIDERPQVFDLLLAGIEVETPAILHEDEHVMTLADVISDEPSITIRSRGDRSQEALCRGYYLSLAAPIAYDGSIDRASEFTTNLIGPISNLGRTMKLGEGPQEDKIRLMVSYGMPEVLGAHPVPCEVGLGRLCHSFARKILAIEEGGVLAIRLDGIDPELEWKARIDLHTRRGRFVDLDEEPGGEPMVLIPQRVQRRIGLEHPVHLEISACGPFDFEPSWEIMQKIQL